MMALSNSLCILNGGIGAGVGPIEHASDICFGVCGSVVPYGS